MQDQIVYPLEAINLVERVVFATRPEPPSLTHCTKMAQCDHFEDDLALNRQYGSFT